MSGGRRVVACLHGSGDTGQGLRRWFAELTGGEWERALKAAGVDVVFPSATPRPYTMAGGQSASVWFDRKALAPRAPEDAEGVVASCGLVERECFRGAAQVAVVGFSQGGCLALHVGLRAREAGAADMKAVVCLSSFLPDDSALWERGDAAAQAGGARPRPSVMMRHGGSDRMVPAAWGESTAARLRKQGADVSWGVVGGIGHEMAAAELKEALAFVLKALG